MKSGISKFRTPFAALLLGVVMLPAHGEGMSKPGMSFKDFDANKDGYLSLNEFKAKGKDELTFKAADLNGDEQVDPGEFDKYLARKATDKSKSGAEQSKPPAGY
jgi:hypothetical protein